MLKDKLIKLSLILVLVGLSMWGCTPASFSGTHLVYQADFSDIPADEQQARLEETKGIIENRVNAYGVADPIIQIEGTDRISVQLPGIEDIEDIDEVIKLIGTPAELDFRKLAETAENGWDLLAAYVTEGDTTLAFVDVSYFTVDSSIRIGTNNVSDFENDYVIQSIDADTNTITIKTGASTLYTTNTTVAQWIPATGVIDGETTRLAGEHFKPNSRVVYQNQVTIAPVILFELKDEGPELFGQITEGLIYKPLGIFLDNDLISAPRVMQKLTDGGSITGLELDEAKLLAIQLNHRALPVKIELISQEVIQPT